MTDILPAGTWTPQEAADYVNEAWRQSVASIVETGRRLIEAKQRVPHGQWLDVVRLTHIGSERATQMFMKIADHPDLGDANHGADLPLSWRTLSELAQLPVGELPKLIEAGKVTPATERKEATALVREARAAARTETAHRETATPDHTSQTVIYRHDGSTLEVPAVAGTPGFNRTNDQVSWAQWTWNPVHGCLHACSYCYAWELSERPSYRESYPEGFAPMFRPERLAAPVNARVPNDPDPRARRVFVSSMGDLFGEWVPQEWIDAVMEACAKAPDWTYLFLTKFPQRYARLTLPPSVWLGTSVDSQKRVRIAERAMARIPDTAVRWLSCEPLLEPLVFKDLSWCDWLVIGSQSANHGQPEFAPPIEWVIDLVAQARAFDVPVYLKPNLLGEVNGRSPGMTLPQEMPRQA